MAYQLKAAGPTRRRKLALWNKDNKGEQGIVMYIPKYADVLRRNCPELCEIVQHEDLWRFLKKYDVTDRVIEDRIKAHDTSEDIVYHLLQHIEQGPVWRLHALLRACSKRHQGHVVTLLGLDPDVYAGPSPPESPIEIQAPFGLMRHEVITPLQHCYSGRPAIQRSISLPSPAKTAYDQSLAVSDVCTEARRDNQKVTHRTSSPLPSTHVVYGLPTTLSHVINLGSASIEKLKSDDETSNKTKSSHLPDVQTQKTLSEAQGVPDSKTVSPKFAEVATYGPSLFQADDSQQISDHSTAPSASQTSDSSSHSVQAIDKQDPPSKTDTVFLFSSPASVNVSPGPQDVAFKKPTPGGPQKGQELTGAQQSDTLTSSQPSDNQIDTEQNKSATPQVRDVAAPVSNSTSENKEHLETTLQRLRESSSTSLDELLKLVGDKDFQSRDVLTTVESVYINNKAGVKGVPTEESERFYQLCLHMLLGSMKVFTEEDLKKFNLLGSVYLSFLNKQSKIDKYKNDITCYYFENETFCDFFACRALETLPDGIRKAMLLKISSRDSFRYLQKLIFRLLGKYSLEMSIPLLVGMTHLLLVQQALNKNPQNKPTSNKEWTSFMSNLQTLLQRIDNDVAAPGELLLEPDSKHALYNETGAELWEMVASTFHWLTGLTTRNTSPYGEDFWMDKYFSLPGGGKAAGFVLKGILYLLTECSPDVQVAVARKTYQSMLPCNSVYPCGSKQWMRVSSNRIECLSAKFVQEGVLQYRKVVTERETVVGFSIDFTCTPSQWGRAPDDHWTRAVWDRTLQAVVSHYFITGTLSIYLPLKYSTPLNGILYTITHLNRSDYPGSDIVIWRGTISLHDLHQWYQESGTKHNRRISLVNTTLQLPADEQIWQQLLQGDEEDYCMISPTELHLWRQESGSTFTMENSLGSPTLQLPAHTQAWEQQLQWLEGRFMQDVKQHIADKGLSEGQLSRSYPLPGGVELRCTKIIFL